MMHALRAASQRGMPTSARSSAGQRCTARVDLCEAEMLFAQRERLKCYTGCKRCHHDTGF